jgi:hypothetical protein
MSLNIRQPAADQGGKVFDISDPDRHDKILGAGPEQSEVKFDDGAVRIVPNEYLHPADVAVAVADDGFSQLNPSPVSEIVRLGQEAMARKRRAWADWLTIAAALQAGRSEVTHALHTNETTGRRFEKAMGAWLIANEFKEINKATRSQLLDCLKHKAEIEKWRSRLTDAERFKFNHPDVVLKKWKRATVVPDPNAPVKITPMQKLKDELVNLIEERDRMKREIERGGGDVWTPEDTPKAIAKIMLGKLSKSKVEKVAREILKAVRGTK